MPLPENAERACSSALRGSVIPEISRVVQHLANRSRHTPCAVNALRLRFPHTEMHAALAPDSTHHLVLSCRVPCASGPPPTGWFVHTPTWRGGPGQTGTARTTTHKAHDAQSVRDRHN